MVFLLKHSIDLQDKFVSIDRVKLSIVVRFSISFAAPHCGGMTARERTEPKLWMHSLGTPVLLSFAIVTVVFLSVVSSDPDPLQDFCIADLTAGINITGFPCKNPALVTVDDFVYSGLVPSANISSIDRAGAIFGTVQRFPGLNTLGLSVARLDIDVGGIIVPHVHPRASELVYVERGSVYAAVVSSTGRLFAKVIRRGEVMIVPRGLLHWQMSTGGSRAKLIVTLNSQFPGIQFIARSMFGPQVPDEVLQKTFFLDKETIARVRSKF
ncbi:germin-like protein subfamily T member 2 isoform X1 [Selaginella moellendorffii]|nr:germin-like protein subfamily T member 2 isoform X1 [Selaginella moellendorffii]XP_024536797.1 germin-like protein subfamily T member 2 isoform X1 [Selaginella moellendorffii]XP_024536798.1 germin-like protein subfamily T member 2 isoform X1 [Selaginella moellendorffii]XP_024536799.1 germin-like protein subfamily T member 2 isoform X1 [Selaginella moellendorffii]|eukprot:XP_002975893.2 germin-like protein subfamily T member 2 isoform X1 [Selaginella moellendorffii]